MNNESHGNKVSELVEYLEGMMLFSSDSNHSIRIRKAIEAIRVLQLIADNAGRLDIGSMLVRDEWWCKEQCQQFLESL